MTLVVAFRRAARTEFVEAAAWYEAQRQNLGVEFIAEVERCVAIAAEQPQRHAVVYKTVRRVTTRRFPYAIYYSATDRRIVVLAIFHSRRDPLIWQGRA